MPGITRGGEEATAAVTWEMTNSTTYKAVYDDGETWYNKVCFDALQDYADKVTA